MQLAFLRPLRREDRQELSLLVTWAIALGIEGVLSILYTTTYRATIPSYANSSWRIAGYQVSEVRVFAFGLSIAILAVLYLVLSRTRFGRAVRATVQNPTSAALLGIDANRISAFGFGISVATAAAAGAVYGIVFSFNPGSHYDLISRLLTIIVLGGMGSLGGAVIAALFMGMAEAVLATTISPTWSSFAFFVVLIAILVVRPQGLFGVRERGAREPDPTRGPRESRGRLRRVGRFPVPVPRELDREHGRLHSDVRRPRYRVEPSWRLLGLPVARPRRVLRRRRLRGRHHVPAWRHRRRIHAVLRPAARRDQAQASLRSRSHGSRSGPEPRRSPS